MSRKGDIEDRYRPRKFRRMLASLEALVFEKKPGAGGREGAAYEEATFKLCRAEVEFLKGLLRQHIKKDEEEGP